MKFGVDLHGLKKMIVNVPLVPPSGQTLKDHSTDLALHSHNIVRLAMDSLKIRITIDAAEPDI